MTLVSLCPHVFKFLCHLLKKKGLDLESSSLTITIDFVLYDIPLRLLAPPR